MFRYFLTLCAGAALLTDCEGVPGAPANGGSAPVPMILHRGQRAFMFVSESSDIKIYRYWQSKYVSTLSVVGRGLCTDVAGHVWVTSNTSSGSELIEYPHSGGSPVATLQDPGYIAESCAVDPTTGNLAVTNVGPTSSGSGSGNVAIYAGASGNPQLFTDSGRYLSDMWFCGYDASGNLFVDGTDSHHHGFGFAELPAGGTGFTNITLAETIGKPGGVQWDGTYIAVMDVSGDTIYEFSIYGSQGALQGITPLVKSGQISQFWINGKYVIGADTQNGDVVSWHYPGGGLPVETLAQSLTKPFGVTVSLGAP